MYKIIRPILYFCLSFLFNSTVLHAQTIGIWQPGPAPQHEAESAAFADFISSSFKTTVLGPEELNKKSSLEGIDILWFNTSDTHAFSPSSTFTFTTIPKKAIRNIRSFVKKGGRLLLTNQAALFIRLLDIEPVMPVTRVKPCVDEGYGRMLGFHSFRAHPLFDGLHGGVYCLKPEMDTTLLQTGYFKGSEPDNGRTIAVDWDYIFLREEKKMLVEWNHGKGKVLMIGGYMLYGLPNRNSLQMERFTHNIINYLSGKSNTTAHYWSHGPRKTNILPVTVKPVIKNPQRWKLPESPLDLDVEMATGNYLEASGERMLAMGDFLGGIREAWSHPFLSIRDLHAAIRFDGQEEPLPLNNLKPEVKVSPWGFTRTYSIRGASLKEVVVASPEHPILVVHYEYEGDEAIEILFKFTANLRMMWPYSGNATGSIYYSWDKQANAFHITNLSRDLFSLLTANKIPGRTLIGPFEIGGFDFESTTPLPADTLLVQGLMMIRMNPTDELDIVHLAGTGEFSDNVNDFLTWPVSPDEVFLEAVQHSGGLLEGALDITSPSMEFNTGYAWSILATDRFFATTPGLGSSLVAGYATSDRGWGGGHAVSGRPGYGWYFGRDGEWSGMALLHYGDFYKVRSMLDMFIQHQDLDGKIFHELSTSGFVHYDAADATPLFLVLAGRYLRHSGDLVYIQKNWEAIKKATGFCYSTDTDGDLLIENTNVGHGWVEGGTLFGSHTSLYLAACWAAALKEMAYMARGLGYANEAISYDDDATQVVSLIENKFWNRKRNFYYHGMFKDGSFHEEPTIMPAIPMLFGQCHPTKASLMLPVFASNLFTSDWGCRIVGENSPGFNPSGYHTGSVWPLFTGWAALAAFKYDNYLQGFSYLMNNLLIYRHWGVGYLEEVLNGATYKPSGVCHHQCWSQTMVQQPAIEGMLGFQPDALLHQMILKPWFPADWDTVSVNNLRVGTHGIGFKMIRYANRTVFLFDHSGDTLLDIEFSPVFAPGTTVDSIAVNGNTTIQGPLNIHLQGGNTTVKSKLKLRGQAQVTIYHHGGIALLPLVPRPEPGDLSKGFRVMYTEFSDNTFNILFQGRRAGKYTFDLWVANGKEPRVNKARLVNKKGNIFTFEIEFMDVETDYTRKMININCGF